MSSQISTFKGNSFKILESIEIDNSSIRYFIFQPSSVSFKLPLSLELCIEKCFRTLKLCVMDYYEMIVSGSYIRR